MEPRLTLANGALGRALTLELDFLLADLHALNRAAVECLLANMVECFSADPPSATVVPMARAFFRAARIYLPGHVRDKHFRAARGVLSDAGLMESWAGTRKGRHSGLATRIWPSEKLRALITEHHQTNDVVQVAPANLIIKKDKEKRLTKYDSNRKTQQMHARLELQNRVRESVDLSFAPGSGATPAQAHKLATRKTLVRIFNGTWNKGGRFYHGYWQSLSQRLRSHILIDGMPTVELDYSWLHPVILYAQRNVTLASDPYEIDGYPELRELGKDVLLIALNADTKRAALGALCQRWYSSESPQSHDGWFNDSIQALREDAKAKKRALLEESGLKVGDLYDRFVARHEAIGDAFGDGIGRELQYLDSVLIDRVTMHFARRRIATLPVHDSVIIAERHEQELRDVMESTFEKEWGVPIRVERK